MTPADVERTQAAREAATEAGGLFVEPEHLRALARYVERAHRGDRNAPGECLGYVDSLLRRWEVPS